MTNPVRPIARLALLSQAVNAARRAPFWRDRLGDAPINSLADFEQLPITPASEYRRQRFDAVLSDVAGIEWIPGAWLGQSSARVAVAEGAAEAVIRVELLCDGLKLAIHDGVGAVSAVVVADESRRYFGAEMCAAFVRMGVAAHLLVDAATDRLEGLLDAFQPDVLVALSRRVNVDAPPVSVGAVVSVSAGAIGERDGDSPIRRVNLLIQNELGVLGTSVNDEPHRMNHHRFHLEQSRGGTLVATPYYARVQPIIRLDTGLRGIGVSSG